MAFLVYLIQHIINPGFQGTVISHLSIFKKSQFPFLLCFLQNFQNSLLFPTILMTLCFNKLLEYLYQLLLAFPILLDLLCFPSHSIYCSVIQYICLFVGYSYLHSSSSGPAQTPQASLPPFIFYHHHGICFKNVRCVNE